MKRLGATDAWDFVNQSYLRAGVVGPSGITFTRASVGYAEQSDGIWQSFASGIPRITGRGLLIEESRINRALHNRDLTNAAWTATNVTVARNQVGIDGTANSACSLTATADNGTVLQTVTHASTARFFSVWVQRLTGTGTVQVTLDNGATWTAVTVTSAWTRVGAAQTLANPTVGVRLVTSGDAIAVDFAQLEDGPDATSPIAVAGTAVTRAADNARADSVVYNYPLSIFAEWVKLTDGTTAFPVPFVVGNLVTDQVYIFHRHVTGGVVFTVLDGGTQTAGIAVGTATFNAIQKTAARAQTDNVAGSFNGAAVVTDTVATMPDPTTTAVFGDRWISDARYINGYVRRTAIFPLALTDAQLRAISS